MTKEELLKKYDVPVPRYTSYPTVPCWDTEKFNEQSWWDAVTRCFDESNATKGISLYVHLPFCESLCTYCACNTRITKNHSVEDKYVASLLREWELYRAHLNATPVIRELHLGGGTPTFFSPGNLSRLLDGLLSGSTTHQQYEFSFEGHPNNTTLLHLETLAAKGFRRVSFGVQDLDERVQKAINRIQPFENLERVVGEARGTGYNSISFDLIYGLPYQTVKSVRDTISKVLQLRPDRIAFYSYAHVPWIKPGQRGYEEADLPSDVIKRKLYEEGRRLFLEAGYHDIGMDHFALPEDSMYKVHVDGKLHRNFMGYTTNETDLLIGLGASSISDANYAYAQNVKKVEDYHEAIASGKTATLKGHVHSEEDRLRRRAILDVTCRGKIDLSILGFDVESESLLRLHEMEWEGIIDLNDNYVMITPMGRPFIRNLAAIFDRKISEMKSTRPLFSKSI